MVLKGPKNRNAKLRLCESVRVCLCVKETNTSKKN